MAYRKRFGGDAQLLRSATSQSADSAFARVQGVMDISMAGGESELIDSTDREDLVSAPYRVQTVGLVSPISVDFEMHWDPDDGSHYNMLLAAEARAEYNWKITVTGMTKAATFRGFQKALPWNFPMAAMETVRTGIALTSRITWS